MPLTYHEAIDRMESALRAALPILETARRTASVEFAVHTFSYREDVCREARDIIAAIDAQKAAKVPRLKIEDEYINRMARARRIYDESQEAAEKIRKAALAELP